MANHKEILANQPTHKALLDSFAMARAVKNGTVTVYPLGFITDLDGKRCECADCLAHRAQGATSYSIVDKATLPKPV